MTGLSLAEHEAPVSTRPHRRGPLLAAGESPSAGARFGARRARRLQRRRARRRRAAMLAALVAALGAALCGTVVALLPLGHTRAGPNSARVLARSAKARTTGGLRAPVEAPAPAVALVDASGLLAAAIVLAPPAPGHAGALLALPGGLATEVPGLGPAPVAAAYAQGGPSLLRAVLENLLGVPLALPAVVGPAQTAGLLGPPSFPGTSDGLGGEPLAVALGEELMAAARARPTGPSAGLAAGVPWAVLAELARGGAPVLSPTVAPLGTEAVEGPSGSTSSPLVPFLAPARGSLGALVRKAFPSQAQAAASRPRVEILNGTGAFGLDAAVFERLVPAVRVEVTGNASRFGQPHTEIVYYGASALPAATLVRKLLGAGELVGSPQEVGAVSVTILVGADLPGS